MNATRILTLARSIIFAGIVTVIGATGISLVGTQGLAPAPATSIGGFAQVEDDPTETSVSPAAGAPAAGFHYAVIEGAKAGNKDAQRILVRAARRGVKQAQRVSDRLGLDWRR